MTKQMPPTAFFTSRVENDEADVFDGEEPDENASEEEREELAETWNRREIKDCPDLLQLAKSVLPNSTLLIHYRSVYRELIQFSNAAFYLNRLSVPARHPEAEVKQIRPIEVVQANGVYQDQANPTEARYVTEVLAGLWNAPTKDRRSVGVVTFNRKQADLIDTVLEERAESDFAFREALAEQRDRYEDGEDMGFFVKNVENVQGDERDIIVFSSTFGRNAQGTFRRTFGVLGQKGGERRLNVAVTRAREKVILVTSMPIPLISDLLSTRRTAASPRDHLQAYFEYARAVSAGELDAARALLGRLVSERRPDARSRADPHDGFQASVAAYIRELGWEPTPTSEDGAFGLDFSVVDPRTGLFGIGIECDAPRHGLLAHARAREMWRPGVLKRSIPMLHRSFVTGLVPRSRGRARAPAGNDSPFRFRKGLRHERTKGRAHRDARRSHRQLPGTAGEAGRRVGRMDARREPHRDGQRGRRRCGNAPAGSHRRPHEAGSLRRAPEGGPGGDCLPAGRPAGPAQQGCPCGGSARTAALRQQDAAAALLNALRRAGRHLPEQVEFALAAASQGKGDVAAAISAGFALLTAPSEGDRARLQALARELKGDDQERSLSAWLESQPPSQDQLLLKRIESPLAELATMVASADLANFEARVARLRRGEEGMRRSLLLDSLAFDLAKALADARRLSNARESADIWRWPSCARSTKPRRRASETLSRRHPFKTPRRGFRR